MIDLCPLQRRNAVKHHVAKLVRSFGSSHDAAESLDDFRYLDSRIQTLIPSSVNPWNRLFVKEIEEGRVFFCFLIRGEGEVPTVIAQVSSPSPGRRPDPPRGRVTSFFPFHQTGLTIELFHSFLGPNRNQKTST